MIRPLRVAHRRVWPALALGLPVLLVAALVARRPVPAVAALPGAAPGAPLVDEIEGHGPDGAPIRMSLHRTADGRAAVAIAATALRGKPELLAYWVPAGGADPLANGTLLGRVRAEGLLPLPVGEGSAPGAVVLYDLARGEVAATATLPPAEDGS